MTQNRKLAKTAGMISGMTMISRIFGYIRDGLGGALLGAGMANDAYLAAFRIPNLLRDLFAEGALSSAFIPTLTETRVRAGAEAAWRLAVIVINAVMLIMLVLVILGEAGAASVVSIVVPGFAAHPEKLHLTIHMTRILMPFLAFVSLAAIMMGILNSHERFGLPAFAPVAFNLTMIAAGLATAPFFGSAPEQQVVWWAWGALLGGFMQLAIQVPAVWKLGFRWRPILDWKDPGLRRILLLMGPAVIGLSVTQINLFMNTLIASFLPEGSVTYLYYGNRLMQLPLGVFGVAIATALLPLSSGHLARGDQAKFKEGFSFGLRLLFVITVPSAVGLIVLAEPINRLLFQYGRFEASAVHAVALASIMYTLGLIGYAGVKVVVPTFYALRDSRTPLLAGVGAVGVNLGLNLIFMRTLGFAGLALAAAIAAYVNFGWLMLSLRRKIGLMGGRVIVGSFLRVSLAAAGMGALVWLAAAYWLPNAGAGLPRWEIAVKVFALIGVGAALYFLFGHLVRIPEQQRVWALLRAKVGLKGAAEPWIE